MKENSKKTLGSKLFRGIKTVCNVISRLICLYVLVVSGIFFFEMIKRGDESKEI